MFLKSNNFVLLFLLLVKSLFVSAQSDSTALHKNDSTQVLFFNYSFDSLAFNAIHYTDTALFSATYFDPLDTPFNSYATLSNTGLAHQSILSPNNPGSIGFDMHLPSQEKYIKTEKDVRFFMPLLPYSEIRYTMGSKKEQQLKVSFSREFAPRLIIGMDYSLINSPGPYLNSKSNNSNVVFSGSYRTVKERYGIGAYYFRNKLEQQENGGIVEDSIFINNIETDRRVIDIWLPQANSIIKSSGFGFEQYFVLSKPKEEFSDTLLKKKYNLQAGRIKHKFLFKRNQQSYLDTDPLNEYYQQYSQVIDSFVTNDSLSTQMIQNSLIWNSLNYRNPNKKPTFNLFFGAQHAVYRLFQGTNDSLLFVKKSNYTQIGVLGGINLNIRSKTNVFARLDMILSGYQAGDFYFYSTANQSFKTNNKDFGQLDFSLNVSSLSPSWFYTGMLSNHFQWENSFIKQNTFELEGSYQFKFLELSVKQTSIDNYTFLNRNAFPEQIGGTINIRSVKANYSLKAGKFEVRGFLSYQKPDIDSVMNLPELAANLKFGFSQSLFKNAAVLQPGFNIRWFSSYYADAYMPALRRFYLQFDKKIGNYPFLDVYLALKVKRANIYIQYSNLLGLTGDYNYFTTPHYPMRDARFYFGVNWRFYQ